MHLHHIIPKYAGGSDDESNLISLTIEEHAEAHKILYDKYGNWQDFCAWQVLSKNITAEEGRILASKKALEELRKDEKRWNQVKDKISKSLKGKSFPKSKESAINYRNAAIAREAHLAMVKTYGNRKGCDPHNKGITKFSVELIQEYREQGLTYQQIAEKVGCGYNTVRRYLGVM